MAIAAGEEITAYMDPETKFMPEGKAKVLRIIAEDNEKCLCWVRFGGDKVPVKRKIYK